MGHREEFQNKSGVCLSSTGNQDGYTLVGTLGVIIILQRQVPRPTALDVDHPVFWLHERGRCRCRASHVGFLTRINPKNDVLRFGVFGGNGSESSDSDLKDCGDCFVLRALTGKSRYAAIHCVSTGSVHSRMSNYQNFPMRKMNTLTSSADQAVHLLH